ncbi:hypothetical protein J6590_014981 [Homalodisca vitripennis]|nr:hypothetical protein J6590_014981 [Homalodisca vitripennis]
MPLAISADFGVAFGDTPHFCRKEETYPPRYYPNSNSDHGEERTCATVTGDQSVPAHWHIDCRGVSGGPAPR